MVVDFIAQNLLWGNRRRIKNILLLLESGVKQQIGSFQGCKI